MLEAWLRMRNLRERFTLAADRQLSRLRRQEGQGSLEYVMIIALVVVVIFGVLWLVREQLFSIIDAALERISSWVESTEADLDETSPQ